MSSIADRDSGPAPSRAIVFAPVPHALKKLEKTENAAQG